jgi:prostaglandin reductase 1
MVVPKMTGISPSLMLGACGMPGNTAYFGFLELCQPK